MLKRNFFDRLILIPLLLTVSLSTGCSVSRYAVGNVMVPVINNARDAAMASDDYKTFRDGAAGNLFLVEGLINTDPGSKDLRINAATLYFAYGFAFQEETDPEYASLLYQHGFEHGLAALSKNKKIAPWDGPFRDFEESLQHLRKKDVPAAVWAAANRSQFISIHLDSTAVLRDIARVTALLERCAELDGHYFNGLVYIMIGSLHSFRPPIMGGDPEASLQNFEKAFSIGGDSSLLAKYFYARFYLYRIQDAEAFENILGDVGDAVTTKGDPYRLLNIVAQVKAAVLLGETDDLF